MLVTRMHGHRIKIDTFPSGVGPLLWSAAARPVPVRGQGLAPELLLDARDLFGLLVTLDEMLPRVAMHLELLPAIERTQDLVQRDALAQARRAHPSSLKFTS